MKKLILLSASLFIFSHLIAQTDSIKDRDLRIEVEPASFLFRGFSGGIYQNITKNNQLSLGLFTAFLDVPDPLRKTLFNNVGQSDTSHARLGFELAVNARYRFKLFPSRESNPYVGVILGWEYFDVSQPSIAGVNRLSTFIFTPYLGYELYFYKRMLYLNPQLRGVTYFGSKSSIENRPESLKSFGLLPQIGIGIRL
jgi:hypothetical protein